MADKKLNDCELEKVNGGEDYPGGKDHYENVILGANPEDHNVMLGSTLDNVNGGAVLPHLSGIGKEVDEQILGFGNLIAQCPVCGFEFPVPQSRKGRQIACQTCGAEFTVK